jgi:hypothetical protein
MYLNKAKLCITFSRGKIMNNKKMLKVFLLVSPVIIQAMEQERHVICTAALADSHFEFRKQQYVEAFAALSQCGLENVFVVEALKKHGPTFLETLSTNVFYATRNNPNLKNHGINEAITLLEGCEHFKFQPEDMVIKFTGRHKLTSDHFLKIVEKNPEFDAFVKVDKDGRDFTPGSIYTLGFAMRYKHLKDMFESLNYADLNEKMIPLETAVGEYIRSKKEALKVCYLDKLGMTANLLGSTTIPGAPQEIKHY